MSDQDPFKPTYHTLPRFGVTRRQLEDAELARISFFTKFTAEGPVRIVIHSLLVADGRVVPAVLSKGHLAFLIEILVALEKRS